jgi:hypothetical protein
MSSEEAKAFGIPADERKQYVRYDKGKVNLVRAGGAAKWFRLVGEKLGNATEDYPSGDEVQAIELWKPPNAWADTSSYVLDAILSDIARGMDNGQRYSGHQNAGKRAAWLVVQKHYPHKPKAECDTIIKAWLKSRLLYTDTYDDPVEYKESIGLYVNDKKRPSAPTEEPNPVDPEAEGRAHERAEWEAVQFNTTFKIIWPGAGCAV